jgi:hypothetical protein
LEKIDQRQAMVGDYENTFIHFDCE